MPSVPEHRPLGPHVHLIVRSGLPETAGNLVTARRLAAGLAAAGIGSGILSADALPHDAPPGPGEVVHALHARWAGVPAVHWAQGRPVIWTFTGTDLDPDELPALRASVGRVAACVVFHQEAADELRQTLPEAAGRVLVIPPGMEAPSGAPPAPAQANGAPVFFLPAGIRRVKNPDLAVSAVETLRQSGGAAELYIAGPRREPSYSEDFLARLALVPFAHYLGELPHADMPGWYARSDVVLNTSRAEGLSNAVLEAMAMGRAVLASDIAGNRAAIRHGVTGWLAAPDALPSAAVRLAADAGLRARLGRAAAEEVRRRFSPEAEVAAHLRLYAEAVAPAGRPRTPKDD